jgi:hypothetical protein
MPMDEKDIAALPLNRDVLAQAIRMTNIERFLHLLHHTKSLVGLHGPYTKHPNTTVFSRDVRLPPRPKPQAPSLKDLALSLAAAQDCAYSAQPSGPAQNDLDFFLLLWDSAVTVLESILARGSLPQESFGWGIFALCAGYMHPPARDLTLQNLFLSRKYHLHAALSKMPALNGERSCEYVVAEKMTTATLTRARRDVHTLAHILLHGFRVGSWRRVRWLHTIAVAERWIGAFGLKPERVMDAPVERIVMVVHDEEEHAEKKKNAAKKHVTFKFP